MYVDVCCYLSNEPVLHELVDTVVVCEMVMTLSCIFMLAYV